MKKSILLLIISGGFLLGYGQHQRLKVILETKYGNLPFGSSVVPLNEADSGIYHVKSLGIRPEKYEHCMLYENNCQDGYREYEKFLAGKISEDSMYKRLRVYSINPAMVKVKLDQKILIFSGINFKEGVKTIIVDENMNKDLSDDRVYTYPIAELAKYTHKGPDEFFEVPVDGFDGFSIMRTKFVFKVSPFDNSYGYKDTVSKYLQVYVRPYSHKEGVLKTRQNNIHFAATNSLNYVNYRARLSLFIPSISGKFDAESFQNPPYKIKDTIAIGGERIVLDSISYNGDTLYVVSLGKSNEKTGFTEGKQAYNIRSKDSYARIFDLSQQKGRMVLIDFWGSWCVPCKEVIPDLKEIYLKYSGEKFTMVSIALENTGNLTEWQKAVLTHGMKWTQIAESRVPDDHHPTTDKFKILAFPSYLLIDENGKIVKRGVGVKYMEVIKKTLENHFEKSGKN